MDPVVDPLISVLDVPVDPTQPFHRFYRSLDWSAVSAEDEGRERIRMLFSVALTGAWPRDPVWDWSVLEPTWNPASWDEPFAQRVEQIADGVRHLQIRAMLLDAIWSSKQRVSRDRRSLGLALAETHAEWARTTCAAEAYPTAWVHFMQARTMFDRFGCPEEALAIETEVAQHALRLLATGDTAGIGASDVIGACCETKKGPSVERAVVEQILEALLEFSVMSNDFHWVGNALDVAEPMQRQLGRDVRQLVELRVAAALRQADLRRDEEGGGLLEQHFVQMALQWVIENGLGRERIDALNERLRTAGARASREMKEIRHEFELSPEMREAREQFLEQVRAEAKTNPSEVLRFAACQHVIPLERFRQAIQSRAPSFLDVIGGRVLVGDRVGGELTPERRAIMDYERSYLGLSLPLFNQVLHVVEEICGADALSKAILDCSAAQGRGDIAVRDGIDAFYKERYAQAVYTLLPELEAYVRAIVRLTGRPRTAYTNGRQREHTLDPLIETLAEALPPQQRQIADFLAVMLSKEDGFNLRNNGLHGLIDPAYIGRAEALIVIHGFLLLSSLGVTQASNEGASEA